MTVVDMARENLERVTGNHPRSRSVVADAGRESANLIASVEPDLVINLLPPAFMAPVARQCLKAGVHLVHPAYLDAETLALDAQARASGLTFLAELGLDPGIDHMSAARTTGLPPAIAARFILEGRIKTAGVLTPVLPEIVDPVLAELAKEGIVLEEKEEQLG